MTLADVTGRCWEVVETWYEPNWLGFARVITERRTLPPGGGYLDGWLVEPLGRRWRLRKHGSEVREVILDKGVWP